MSKPLDSLLSHDPGESKNVSISKDINGCVKTSEKVVKYWICFVINSSHKKCEVEAMMAMKKDKACKWFHHSVRKHACVKPSQAITVPVVVNVDHSKSIVSCSNIKQVICNEKSKADNVDKKKHEKCWQSWIRKNDII